MQGREIDEARARGGRDVRAKRSANPVEQERVARADPQPPCPCEAARVFCIVEQPAQLASREIWVQRQSGALESERLESGAAKPLHIFARSLILPYDRVIEGTLRLSVPGDNCFALVGETNRV